MEIKVGCCGFQKNRKEYFKNFSLVELQSTFYQLPEKIEIIKKLRKEAPKNFEFSIKAFQVITHDFSSPTYKKLKTKFGNPKNYGSFKNTKEVLFAWEKTKEIAKILKAKIILFQTPPSFKQERENIENLRRFFKKIKKESFIFAWEVRGKWERKILAQLQKEFDFVHCVDPFKEKPVSGKLNYFRLHGKPGYNLKYKYTLEDFEYLLNLCREKESYVLFNNLSMFKDALKFKKLIKLKNEKVSL